jgi:hypothetical protein
MLHIRGVGKTENLEHDPENAVFKKIISTAR